MRFRRRREADAGPVGPSVEATQAREKAEEDLSRTMSETPYYAALGESLRRLREENHLTELFYAIHRGD